MTLKEEAEQLAKDRPTSLSDDLYQWAMDAEEMLWKLSAQAAQPAPRRLTEAEITLLVEAYYEDVGIAPPDLIRQVEGLIFGDAQPAHAHEIDTSPERVEKQAGNVQVPAPVNCCPGSPGWPIALRDSTIDTITDGCFQAVGYQGTTALMRAVARAIERHHGIAAPSTEEQGE